MTMTAGAILVAEGYAATGGVRTGAGIVENTLSSLMRVSGSVIGQTRYR
jgi:hypothetical protein